MKGNFFASLISPVEGAEALKLFLTRAFKGDVFWQNFSPLKLIGYEGRAFE